jgi:hypothetical protein
MPQMKESQRTAQLWSLLLMAAKAQFILSFQDVEYMTGLPSNGFNDELNYIYQYCDQNRLPLLTSLVVGKESGNPGDLEKYYSERGVSAEQRRSFTFDWEHWARASKDRRIRPSVEDFKQLKPQVAAAA